MSLSPLDREFLDELIDGDLEFGGELLEAFEEAGEQCLNEAEAACREGDIEKAVRAFHTLKGSAASVGLPLLCAKSVELEALAKACELAQCAAGLPELEVHVHEGRRLLAQFLADPIHQV